MLFFNKEKQSTNICYNTGEPWKYDKWKKPGKKGYVLYDSIYINCPE